MNAAPDLRVAPHNIEVEQALLGAILMHNTALDRIADILEPEHFFEPLHKQIFHLARSLIHAGKVANPITLLTFLPADVDVAGLTVKQYLARLAAEATGLFNVDGYARTIYDLAVRRGLITLSQQIGSAAYEADVDASPRDQIEEIEKGLYALAEHGRYGQGFMPFEQAAVEAMEMAARSYQNGGGLSGLATGLGDLDQQLGGMQASDLIIIAGRPGMGKTALATNIAFNVAKAFEPKVAADGTITAARGGRVGFFSLEMSAEQLATRILSAESGVSSANIRRGTIVPKEFDTLTDVARERSGLPLEIDQTGGLSIAQVCARARRLKRQRGLDLLVVDYIQLLNSSLRRPQDNRVQEVTHITSQLKALAKELDVPILAVSQLSRAVETRDDKRPQLSDLRESGSIEQDADVVAFVFRAEYYLGNREPKPGTEDHVKWSVEMERAHGKADVIIAKQRHGPTGTVQLQFDQRLTRFSDPSYREFQPS